MEKEINNVKRKRKRNKNINKLNLALLSNGTKKKNIPIVKSKHPTLENILSQRKNTVQSKRIIRAPNSKVKYTMEYDVFENEPQQFKHSKINDVVRDIPYYNKTECLDTIVKLPQKYPAIERNKKLMNIICSYLVDDDDPETQVIECDSPVKQNVRINNNFACILNSPHKYDNIEKNENHESTPILTPVLTPTIEPYNKILLCSEDKDDESPHYTYYPHRLNQ